MRGSVLEVLGMAPTTPTKTAYDAPATTTKTAYDNDKVQEIAAHDDDNVQEMDTDHDSKNIANKAKNNMADFILGVIHMNG